MKLTKTKMKTLKELIEAQKSRKGESRTTTERGAYWLVGKPIKIRSYGGDGIGQNSPRHQHFLEFWHFRDGAVRAKVHLHSWHQNYSGCGDAYRDAGILNCKTVEDVIVALKSKSKFEDDGTDAYNDEDDGTNAYSDDFHAELTERLTELGMVASLPAPDEEIADAEKALAETQNQNARLIASAPELLSALERGLAVIKAARRIACNRPIAENPLVAEMQTAGGAVLAMEDAIAKAKGGA